ncbi:MAG: type VI secretion system baseplate subunit TssE [Caulobacteraceae bacterium]|nr:MAG: type VI secretion system baseplate subunit TssE [Caulobacteraceae bacterium]
MADAKLTPSLFDKLTIDDRVTSIIDDGPAIEAAVGATQLRLRPVSQLERYNEGAMRTSVRRELNWLLNTVHLGAVQDLSRYPHVARSVLNYGMPDLTGRVSSREAVQGRARQIEESIRLFEPRLDADKLHVEVGTEVGIDNAVSYVIRGDIVSAVRAMPVQFFANVEVETGEAVVRE